MIFRVLVVLCFLVVMSFFFFIRVLEICILIWFMYIGDFDLLGMLGVCELMEVIEDVDLGELVISWVWVRCLLVLLGVCFKIWEWVFI